MHAPGCWGCVPRAAVSACPRLLGVHAPGRCGCMPQAAVGACPRLLGVHALNRAHAYHERHGRTHHPYAADGRRRRRRRPALGTSRNRDAARPRDDGARRPSAAQTVGAGALVDAVSTAVRVLYCTSQKPSLNPPPPPTPPSRKRGSSHRRPKRRTGHREEPFEKIQYNTNYKIQYNTNCKHFYSISIASYLQHATDTGKSQRRLKT